MNNAVLHEPIVVLGGGLAAVSFAGGLRSGGFDGEITVVSDEVEPAYDRPPLSKEFQREGVVEAIRLDLSRARDVEWLRGTAASQVETQRREVLLTDQRVLNYGTLVFATGATPRALPALQDAPMPVITLRTLSDAKQIRNWLAPGTQLVVVGGGVIGLELAAIARGIGASVTVIEALDRLMSRCASVTLAAVVARSHIDHGVNIRLGREVVGFNGPSVVLDNGARVAADVVVVCIGVFANDQLARAAGIACDDGIFVDRLARTTCPGVYAIGDVTRQRNPINGRFERIETWSNAKNQGLAAARTLLDPAASPYAEVPWYWSDQYNLRLQVAGIPNGDEEIVRGEAAPGASFSLIQLSRGRAVGVTCMNNAREFSLLKRVLGNAAVPDRDTLSDPLSDLRKLLA